ncbi:NACHT domain-containing protein [Fusarium sp. LHS14.1]|nr:NACHT domain-containing protein [Fusarium sp. LHS14.1]
MLYDQEIGRWLGSSVMRQQSQYHAYLQDLRADQACEFLLEDASFINWYRASNSENLVLLGEMGTGKTVAMGFLVDELRRRSELQLPQAKLCFYYCQNAGPDQAAQILSCLILSLLDQLPGLKKSFYEWYKQAKSAGNFEPSADTKKLREFLQRLLETIDRQVFFVIDGLDECDMASRGVVFECLGALSQKTPRLKVLLSFRPQEEIMDQVERMSKITLGCDTKRDGLIVRKAFETQLSRLPKDVKALVIERVSHLAQGSAIWAKMVIELIQTRGITAFGPMRLFLEQVPLPSHLSELYSVLLSRCTSNDINNERLANKALAILAIARRPLSILELAWAVAMGTAPLEVTTVAALGETVDHHRLMRLIHPFVGHLDSSDLKKRQVRLIHQSVKAFILEHRTDQLQSPATLATADQVTLQQRTESLEGLLLEICVNYLQLEEIGTTEIFPEEQVVMEALPRDVDLFSEDALLVDYEPGCSWEDLERGMVRYDPVDRGFGEFFVYASCYWIHHFGAVTTHTLPSLTSIENLCRAGSTRLDNWAQQNCRPDCATQPRFEFDSSLYDPLSITSLYGSEAMLRGMLENSDFDEGKFLPNPLIGAVGQILQWGDFARVKILLESKHGHQLKNLDFFRLIMNRWSAFSTQFKDWDQVFDHVDFVLDISVRERWAGELFCVASGAGCKPLVRRLTTRAQHNTELKNELMRGLWLQ